MSFFCIFILKVTNVLLKYKSLTYGTKRPFYLLFKGLNLLGLNEVGKRLIQFLLEWIPQKVKTTQLYYYKVIPYTKGQINILENIFTKLFIYLFQTRPLTTG